MLVEQHIQVAAAAEHVAAGDCIGKGKTIFPDAQLLVQDAQRSTQLLLFMTVLHLALDLATCEFVSVMIDVDEFSLRSLTEQNVASIGILLRSLLDEGI